MSFRFDFGGDSASSEPAVAGQATPRRHVAPAAELNIAAFQAELDNGSLSVVGETVECGPGTVMFRRSVADVHFQVAATDDMSGQPVDELAQSIELRTDLIPGVYEGGLKTWECSIELIKCLSALFQPGDLCGSRIIELGCGSALPGIHCLAHLGADQVDFQDYNEPVLKMVTVPNILLNTTGRPLPDSFDANGRFETELTVATEGLSRSRLFSGDWGSLKDLFSSDPKHRPYDMVLTSETVYDATSVPILFDLIKAIVRPGGTAFIAAKAVYFGCSGSLGDIVQLAERDERCKRVERVAVNEDLVRREVVRFWL